MDIGTLILLALAVTPAVVLITYVYHKDRYDKEPLMLLFFCFGAGVLSIIPAVAFSTFFSAVLGLGTSTNLIMTAVYAVIGVGLSEEFAKFLFLRFYAYPKKAFDEPYDGIIYALMIGMGFATGENLMYIFSQDTYSGMLQVGVMRALTSVPAHASFAVVMGYYAGLAKFHSNANESRKLLLKGLFFAMLLHGVYDFFLFTGEQIGLWFGALVALYIGIRFSRNAIAEHQRNSPFRSRLDKDSGDE